MLKKTPLYHFRTYSFQLLLVTVACCFSGITGFSQQLNFNQAKQQLDQQIGTSKEPTITALYFFRTVQKAAFTDVKEWYKTLNYIESCARENHGSYYAQVCTEIGQWLQTRRNYQEAYYYLYKARTDIAAHPPRDKRFLTDYHEALGLSYFYFKRYDEARQQFLLAHRTPGLSQKKQVSLLNTLGLVNRDQGYTDSSKIYFEQALSIARAIPDTPWTAIISGNLGHYYWLKKSLKKARRLTQLDYTISLASGQRGSALNALSLLISLDLAEHQPELAQQKLADLESMLKHEYNTSEYAVYYRAKTAVLEATGHHKEALESYRTVVLYQDTIGKQTDIENLKKTEFQINFEHKQSEVLLLHEKKKRDEIIIYGLIGMTIVVIVVFAVIINLNAKRRKREKEIAALKQHQVETELESTEKEMRTMLSNLIEKNALIEHLTEEIHQFQTTPEQPISEEKVKMIDKLQSFTLLTDDDWLEFKKLFEKLNPNFFHKVLSHSPDLTNAEIRLITLIKLNLSNLEMSRALGISPDSVRKTSLRLRKKLNIELHEELVKFILSL